MAEVPPPAKLRGQDRLLLFSVLVIATCGLIYELITATMASYLLGDSVTQFSLVIGIYLSAMGLGSWLSKFIERHLHNRFITVQLTIAVVGGLSATVLFLGFAHLSTVRPILFSILVVVGTMVGLEIPLLMRIMKEGQTLKDLVARVLAFDYLGALAASILFPLALLPHLGLVRTSLLFCSCWATASRTSASDSSTRTRSSTRRELPTRGSRSRVGGTTSGST
jgi:spermidine synthase